MRDTNLTGRRKRGSVFVRTFRRAVAFLLLLFLETETSSVDKLDYADGLPRRRQQLQHLAEGAGEQSVRVLRRTLTPAARIDGFLAALSKDVFDDVTLKKVEESFSVYFDDLYHSQLGIKDVHECLLRD